jgi:hypothetical protein
VHVLQGHSKQSSPWLLAAYFGNAIHHPQAFNPSLHLKTSAAPAIFPKNFISSPVQNSVQFHINFQYSPNIILLKNPKRWD